MADNGWRSPDPQTLLHLPDRELILFWISEYDRLSRLLTEHYETPSGWPGSPESAERKNLRREVRNERDIAAARVVGFTSAYLRSIT